jgi:hypothetical protein
LIKKKGEGRGTNKRRERVLRRKEVSRASTSAMCLPTRSATFTMSAIAFSISSDCLISTSTCDHGQGQKVKNKGRGRKGEPGLEFVHGVEVGLAEKGEAEREGVEGFQ